MDHIALQQSLQDEIDAAVSENRDVFSSVLGVATADDEFHWAGASGTAYADKTEEMRADTPIYIASITKMYVAAATLILEERGLLSLDDPLSKFLPADMLDGLHRYKGREYSDQLRIYHLLSHTSGLPDYFTQQPKGGKSIFDLIVSGGDREWDLDKVVRIAKTGLYPKFPPEPKEKETSGKKAHYSDTNYQLLGSVIGLAAQKPLDQILADLILEPLELSSTYMHGHRGAQVTGEKRPADIYYKTQPLILDRAMTSFGPDGGMVSNVEECLTFIGNLMQGKLFANPATLERMQNWKSIFFPFQYGLGLMRFRLPRILSPFSASPELIGHSGATSAFLFQSDMGPLYIAGTLNQLENQGRPVRLMTKIVGMIRQGGFA